MHINDYNHATIKSVANWSFKMINILLIICITNFLFASNIYCKRSYDQNSGTNKRNIIGELIYATVSNFREFKLYYLNTLKKLI